MRNRIRLISLLTVVFLCNVSGQVEFRDGFIVTAGFDTVYGQVAYRSNFRNYQSCIFKNEQGESEYFPDQLAGFGYVGDKYFTSRITHVSFVEVLVTGSVNLYRARDKYFMSKGNEIYSLSSRMAEAQVGGKKVLQEENKWRGYIAYLISDCFPDANSLVSKIGLQERSLTKLIVSYNECKGTGYTVYKSDKPWIRVDFGATAGLSRSTILVTDKPVQFRYLDDSYKSLDPTIGLLFVFSSPKITERFSFRGELDFQKSNFASLVEITGAPVEMHETHIKYTTWSLPVTLQYSVPVGHCDLSMHGGINFDLHQGSESRHLTDHITRGTVVSLPEEDKVFETRTSQAGLVAGLGVLRPWSRFTAGLSVRTFLMPDLNRTEGFAAKENRITFDVTLIKK